MSSGSRADALTPQVQDGATKAVKHTPGPWTVYDDRHPERELQRIQIAARGKTIAHMYCTRGDEAADGANARLIAASPDLLEALTALYERAMRELADPEDVPELLAAVKALAKAA